MNPKINIKFIKILIKAIYKILFLDNYIKKNKVKYILGCTNNYVSLSAFSLRLGLKYKIKTFHQKIYNIAEVKKVEDTTKNTYSLNKIELKNKYHKAKKNIFDDYFNHHLLNLYLFL